MIFWNMLLSNGWHKVGERSWKMMVLICAIGFSLWHHFGVTCMYSFFLLVRIISLVWTYSVAYDVTAYCSTSLKNQEYVTFGDFWQALPPFIMWFVVLHNIYIYNVVNIVVCRPFCKLRFCRFCLRKWLRGMIFVTDQC